MKVQRFDRGELALPLNGGHARRDGAGALSIQVRFARAENVQVYGSTRAYRPASEVFDSAAMASFEGVLVTIGHAAMLDAKNWKDHAVGYLRGVKRDGEYLAGEIVVTDDAAIASVLDGSLTELSAGYWSEDERRSGVTPAGEVYDEIMRRIRGNHVALLGDGQARAGRGVRIVA